MKQEIHFVTGKGGVGKSLIAAAIALNKSREGKRVLLVELGDQSFFKDFLDLSDVGFQPKQINSNLNLALWSGAACLQEYARHLIKVESLAKLFFENPVMKTFVNVAPALPELAILGKVTSGVRKHGPALPFDCLVVDSFATGHFIALLEAPKGMSQAIQFGPMGEQSRGIDAVIRNPDICKYHIVTLPEELPVKETTELQDTLKSDFSLIPDLILNKFFTTTVPADRWDQIEDKESDIGKFAAYLKKQLEHQQLMLNKLELSSKNIKTVPLFFETQPWPLIEKIAESLK